MWFLGAAFLVFVVLMLYALPVWFLWWLGTTVDKWVRQRYGDTNK